MRNWGKCIYKFLRHQFLRQGSVLYPGRLIHADIAGPFRCSTGKQFRWLLVLIDDHTRFKFVYFLKNKSEAPKKAAEFVAQFNHTASSKSVTPVRVVGHVHMDNAAEFLSREFKDFRDEKLISRTDRFRIFNTLQK